MPKYSFENIHPNKFAAFIDGVASTVAVLWLIRIIRKH